MSVGKNPRRPAGGIPWSIEDSLELYGVNAWGNGYFGINAAGHVVVRPDQTADREIDLHEVIRGLEARDLSTPVVVRFSDILHHRLKRLHDAFATAIAENTRRYSRNQRCAGPCGGHVAVNTIPTPAARVMAHAKANSTNGTTTSTPRRARSCG